MFKKFGFKEGMTIGLVVGSLFAIFLYEWLESEDPYLYDGSSD